MTQKSNPVQTGDAAALLRDQHRMRELLRAPETRRFLELLQSQNGAQLKSAAEQARRGDSSALTEMLRRMRQSQEGAQAMEVLESRLEK